VGRSGFGTCRDLKTRKKAVAEFIYWADLIAACLFVAWFVRGIYASRRSELGIRGTLSANAKELVTRSTILELLTVVAVILIGTLAGYAAVSKEEAYDYCAFVMPCLAGIFAGFGILNEDKAELYPLKKSTAFWYIFSVGFIILGFVGYLLRHPHKAVSVALIYSSATSFLVLLVVLLFKNTSVTTRSERIIKYVFYILFAIFLGIIGHDAFYPSVQQAGTENQITGGAKEG
jgi:hypothetical protein